MNLPASPLGPHVSPEALREALRSPDATPSVEALRHVASCADCSVLEYELEAMEGPARDEDRVDAGEVDLEAAWTRFTSQVAGTGEAGAPSPPLPFRARSIKAPSPGIRLLFAACLALGVGSAILLRAPREVEDLTRGTRATATPTPSGPEGDLDEAPTAFPLPEGPGRIAVFDASHDYEWWSAPVENGPVAFPLEERRRLRPGVTYYWTAVGLESSRAVAFRVRRAIR